MNTKSVRNSFLLVITAAIWGFTFVAQSVGGDAIGPYAFNFIRFIIGSIILLPVIAIKNIISNKNDINLDNNQNKKINRKKLIIGALCCGISLCIASNFQQVGINMGTSAGKAGFLTACYILIVPILGIFLKKKCSFNVWIGVVLALIGLFLLCIDFSEGFSVQGSDLIVLISAFCFSIQILFVDHFSPLVDGVKLSCLQFLIAGLLSAIPTFIFDLDCKFSNIKPLFISMTNINALIPILYAGIMSCGVAYTLQVIAQNGLNPTIASLLMSLESVFSVIGGWLILHEILSIKELIGCLLVFIAICLAQVNIDFRKSKNKI